MKPKGKQGLTAEEVSGLLGVAKNTVRKYFDKAILTGWKNSTTGRIAIDPKSVRTFVARERKRAIAIRKAVDKFAGRERR